MKITGITVEGVGRFGTRNRITGFGTGVHILAAGNEAGKSTFFRAIRTCLFERHTAKSDAVKALATEGMSLPIAILLDFEHQGHSYSLSKSFLKNVYASLLRDGTELARGRDADERIWELLGLAQSGTRAIDDAAFGLLWVEQGKSFEVPTPSAAAANTLNAAIQQEVGTLVGGERARKALDQLKLELGKLVTEASGKPKAGGPLAEAEARKAQSEAELMKVKTRLADLDRHFDDLARLQADLKRLSDPLQIHQDKEALREARQSLEQALESRQKLEPYQIALSHAKALLQNASQAAKDKEECAKRIEDNKRRLAKLQEDLADRQHALDDTEQGIAAATAALRANNGEEDALNAEEKLLVRAAQAAAAVGSRDRTLERIALIENILKRLEDNASALARNLATAELAEAFDRTEHEIAKLEDRLSAQAAHVSIDFDPAKSPQIRVDGAPIAAALRKPATAPVMIELGDFARISVTPPPAAGQDLMAQKATLEARLKQILQQCDCRDGMELRRQHAARVALESEASGLMAERAALALKHKSPGTEIHELRVALTAQQDEMLHLQSDFGGGKLPDAKEIETRRAASAEKRAALREARAAQEAQMSLRSKRRAELATELGQLRGSETEIAPRLKADLAALPDETRESLLAEARKHEQECFKEFEERQTQHRLAVEATPSEDEIHNRKIRVSRLETADRNRQEELAKLQQDIAYIRGQIETAGGDGLGERAEAIREECEIASREVERLTDRVATLQLLRQTIETSYARRREQLNAPLRRHLTPYLNDVFPRAELELGEGFAISGIRRGTPGSEDFDRLSDGTREQIAILVRLAMAAMIGERGQNVPIILDDPLVFSDDTRIGQMFDALNRAGEKQQVIVLTCHQRRFQALGGRTLRIEPVGAQQTAG